jgi:hypothetical protein
MPLLRMAMYAKGWSSTARRPSIAGARGRLDAPHRDRGAVFRAVRLGLVACRGGQCAILSRCPVGAWTQSSQRDDDAPPP